jgi:RHS repeat-associated protein
VTAATKYIITTQVQNNSTAPTVVTLQQANAEGKWLALATDEVYATKDVSIEVTPNFSSPMRLSYSLRKGLATDNITVASINYIRVDKQASSRLVILCNTDADFSDDYRYGFNVQEKDNEMKGTGNSLDFGARIYDSRLGRWMSLDPLQAKYPSLSPYNFVANSPLMFIDPDGKRIIISFVRFIEGQTKPIIEKVIYKNGVLTKMDGSAYDGNNQYILNVAARLNKLRANDPRFEDIINFHENDQIKGKDVDHTISNKVVRFEFKKNGSDKIINNLENDGSQVQRSNGRPEEIAQWEGLSEQEKALLGASNTIRFVPEVDLSKSEIFDSSEEEILIHEFKHSWNLRHGGKKPGANANGCPYEEINAMHIQNIQRKIEGKEPRTKHSDREMEEKDKVNLDSHKIQ